jgi:hypothetical protein
MSKLIFTALMQFAGTWNGQGIVTDSLEKTFSCDSMEIQVLHDERSVQIKNAHFVCGALENKWELPSFEIHGTELFHEGKKIGKITDDRIKFDTKYNGYTQKIDMSLENGALVYREYWVNEGTKAYIMSFEGNLGKDSLHGLTKLSL